MNAHARGVALLSWSGSTEKVPLNLIEVILAQGSSFETSAGLVFRVNPFLFKTRPPAKFCWEQINGTHNFTDSQPGVVAGP